MAVTPSRRSGSPCNERSGFRCRRSAGAAILAHEGGAQALAEADAAEIWRNDRYVVTVTRWAEGELAGQVQELSIRRDDRRAIHDWRDFQRIKNEIARPEVEAMEIYPAESRLMDTANQYYLFCSPLGNEECLKPVD
jgi:hypothetical protein